MYADAFLAPEQAAHAQREHAAAASRTRLARLAMDAARCSEVPTSFLGRLSAAFRPAPEPCPTDC